MHNSIKVMKSRIPKIVKGRNNNLFPEKDRVKCKRDLRACPEILNRAAKIEPKVRLLEYPRERSQKGEGIGARHLAPIPVVPRPHPHAVLLSWCHNEIISREKDTSNSVA